MSASTALSSFSNQPGETSEKMKIWAGLIWVVHMLLYVVAFGVECLNRFAYSGCFI